MVAIPRLGIKQSLISPIPEKIDQMEYIKPKLEEKSADYDGAKAYAVVDLDNQEVLSQKNFSKKLPIASLTKIMTAIIALDLAGPYEKFIVSETAASEVPTKVMLKTGEKYSLDFLLRSALISSANDSAQVIKYWN